MVPDSKPGLLNTLTTLLETVTEIDVTAVRPDESVARALIVWLPLLNVEVLSEYDHDARPDAGL